MQRLPAATYSCVREIESRQVSQLVHYSLEEEEEEEEEEDGEERRWRRWRWRWSRRMRRW